MRAMASADEEMAATIAAARQRIKERADTILLKGASNAAASKFAATLEAAIAEEAAVLTAEALGRLNRRLDALSDGIDAMKETVHADTKALAKWTLLLALITGGLVAAVVFQAWV